MLIASFLMQGPSCLLSQSLSCCIKPKITVSIFCPFAFQHFLHINVGVINLIILLLSHQFSDVWKKKEEEKDEESRRRVCNLSLQPCYILLLMVKLLSYMALIWFIQTHLLLPNMNLFSRNAGFFSTYSHGTKSLFSVSFLCSLSFLSTYQILLVLKFQHKTPFLQENYVSQPISKYLPGQNFNCIYSLDHAT